MPQLRPFRGLRYDPHAAGDAGALLCPPYDVISPERRAELAARHPYNAVHLELPAGTDANDAGAPYREAGRLLDQWRTDGVLRRDPRPTLYVYEQRYSKRDGERRITRGFYCLLRLEPFGPDSAIRPHERTMAGPKEDRYQLLRAVDANLSPVVLLYESDDDGALSAQLLRRLTSGPPELEADDDDGISHLLWTADPETPDAARSLLAAVSSGPLTIADGHHRYETALRYRDERRAASAAGATSTEYVMVLLYDAATSGLNVLPTHRLVRDVGGAEAVFASAGELFDVTREDSLGTVLARLSRPGRLGLWTRSGAALLEVKRESMENVVPRAASAALRWLDVTVLTSALPRLLGSSAQELLDSGRLVYIKDAHEAVARVNSGEADVCFLLPPTPIGAVLAVAAAGEQMPHKSTYFYPKAATGLVFNPLAE